MGSLDPPQYAGSTFGAHTNGSSMSLSTSQSTFDVLVDQFISTLKPNVECVQVILQAHPSLRF